MDVSNGHRKQIAQLIGMQYAPHTPAGALVTRNHRFIFLPDDDQYRVMALSVPGVWGDMTEHERLDPSAARRYGYDFYVGDDLSINITQ